jgi:hypothetical protein
MVKTSKYNFAPLQIASKTVEKQEMSYLHRCVALAVVGKAVEENKI